MLSFRAFEWKWGWWWPCFAEDSTAFLMQSPTTYDESRIINIRKARSPPASLSFKGHANKDATVNSLLHLSHRWVQQILLVLIYAKLHSNPCDSPYTESISVTNRYPIGAIFLSFKLTQSTLLKTFLARSCECLVFFFWCESCPVFFFCSLAPHFPKELSLLHKQAILLVKFLWWHVCIS